jgi:hypothetical protein
MREGVDHSGIMNATDKKRRDIGFENLNEAERIVSLTSYADFEIANGGIGQFYENTAGEFSIETVSAFEVIGAPKAAGYLRRSNNLFAGGEPPRQRDARLDAVKLIEKQSPESDNSVFWAITCEFYDHAEDIFGLVCHYIEDHLAELPDPLDK